jgi:hypothetical protein
MFKIQAIRDKLAPREPIDVYLTCSDRTPLQDRALDFIRRFDFVRDVGMRLNYGLLKNDGTDRPPFTPGGYWDYLEPDGWYEFKGERYCVLIPNAPLERGIRLENWLPQYPIDWNIFLRFHITPEERAYGNMVREKVGPYAVFYPGPIEGNTTEGHNRGMLWQPAEWIALGEEVHKLGLKVVVVGAAYDYDYYRYMLAPRLNGASSHWVDLIGRTSLGELWSVTSNAKFVISYQAGVGIVSTYLGTPTAMWWRRRGDSISRSGFLSFEEEMASAWVPPATLASGNYLPMIYGEHKVGRIVDEITSRGWCK